MKTPSPLLRGLASHPFTWVAVLAAGVLLRVLAAFPSFRNPLQSDSVMTGLTAFEILRGDLQVFLLDGTRHGALQSYLHLPIFALFGSSRATLHIAPALTGIVLLVAFGALARELLGPKEGLVALLLLAVPSPVVLLWNTLPDGYTETLLFITAVLYFAARVARRGPEPLSMIGFGLAAGLGWWGSALSLAGTLPAALWILLHRSGLIRSWRVMGLAAAGMAAGALPWIIFNIRHPLASFGGGRQGNFAFASAGGLDQFLDNAGRLFSEILPDLLLRADSPRPAFMAAAVGLAGVIHGAALLFALVQVSPIVSPSFWRGPPEEGVRPLPPLLLPLLVAGCAGAFFVLSAAGGIPGDVARYVVQIGLAVPLFLAHFLVRVGSRSRAVAAVLLAVLLSVHLSGVCLPGSPMRAEERRLARAEDRLLELLAARQIGWVFGPYWDVYGLNFLSRETLRAIPDLAAADSHSYGRKLPFGPVPFALVFREPGAAAVLALRAGLAGETVDVDGAFEVFFAASTESPVRQVRLLRKAMIPSPLPPEALRSRLELLEGGNPRLRLKAGGRREIQLRVTHAGHGALWIPAQGPAIQGAVRVGVRWFRDSEAFADQRTGLPSTLAPGESAELEIDLDARDAAGDPLPPGTYEVRIGLIQGLEHWFATAGDGEIRLAVEVE